MTDIYSPTISVVVATYGDDRWRAIAERAVRSVHAQTVAPLELIQIHGDTLHGARNEGAQRAKGEYLVFLDGDDELDPEYIAMMHEAISGQATYCLVQPATFTVGVDEEPALIPAKPLDEGNFMVIGTAVPRLLMLAVGGFLDWPLYEDWCLWIRCTLAGAGHVACPGAVYMVHRDTVGRNLPDRDVQERYFAEIRDSYFR